MRNITLLTLCLCTILSTNVYAEEYKIGTVNTSRILEQSPQIVAADELIKKEFSLRERALIAQQKKIKSMEDRFEKDSAIMSEQERKKLERDILSERRIQQRDQDEYREDVNLKLNEVRADIQEEMLEAIQKVAKEQGYDLVLFNGVAYVVPSMDISDLVIAYLKEKAQ